MSFSFKNYDFASLSLKDLLEARDLYHLHLMNKKNVVATAVGFYRIREFEPWPGKKNRQTNFKNFKNRVRTLQNSEVRPYSWPSILVFVEKWETENGLAKTNPGDLVPRTLFLPNGKAIPVCVIEASKINAKAPDINFNDLSFPRNIISGGFPLYCRVQEELRIASLGCLVTDGHLSYALTNKHVAGEPGTKIYTRLGDEEVEIGTVSDKQLNRKLFEEVYPRLPGANVYVNMDIGLIEVNDLTIWKTEIFNIGQMDEMVDLHSSNISLQLIGKKVVGFGAASGNMEGEIQALFYRYKSTGGFEYISDFLIGSIKAPSQKKSSFKASKTGFNIGHGDSGTILLLEQNEIDDNKKEIIKRYPVGIIWGKHELGNDSESQPYGLATCLSTTCNLLGIDLVRNWNVDMPNTWGKTGHFKIGAKACELVTNTKLKKLLMANQGNIGYTDTDLEDGNVVKANSGKFVPLADVADLVWRSSRKMDDANHFADMDESDPRVANGKTLMQLCNNENNVDVTVWNNFYQQFEAIDSKRKPAKRGALPFRIWQMYKLMVKYASEKKVAEFVCTGGLMSHYVGDACQSLHISHLHHGNDDSESKVHADYETGMLDTKMIDLFVGVNAKAVKVKASDLIGPNGKDAAIRVIKLMKKTIQTLSPDDIIASWKNASGAGKSNKMWTDLGTRTVKNIAEGSRVLAILWQSAWKAGNGDAIGDSSLVEISKQKLMGLYNTKTFAEAFRLRDPKFVAQL